MHTHFDGAVVVSSLMYRCRDDTSCNMRAAHRMILMLYLGELLFPLLCFTMLWNQALYPLSYRGLVL